MHFLIALPMLIGAAEAPAVAKAGTSCSTETYKRADASLISAARRWSSLSKHRKTFVACDDGALAEGYSDAVVGLLAHQWDSLQDFAALSESDPAFRRWAIRHIDASASTDDLKAVVLNSAKCHGKAKTVKLCEEVRKAASEALTD